jgi:hypothetical protein
VEPAHIRFGGGAADTILHPLIALVLCVTIALIFWLPRKHVVIPLLLTVFLVPVGQVVVLGGVHFTVYRIIILSGLVRLAGTRLLGGKRLFAGGLNGIDRAFVLCSVFTFITFLIQWMEAQAFIKGLGSLLDALGGYFVLRFLIQDREGVRRAITTLAVVVMVLAICMANEQVTHRNLFGLLGGVPLEVIIRDGKVRSMGSFEVYITAGAFGATLLPLFIWLWSEVKAKLVGLLGIVGASVVTLTSNSSTPLLAYVAGIVALCFWPLRRNMRAFRWGLVCALVGLHLCMKAPVWALIARIDLTGSSSGYHRFMLVDQCIRHFGDWWLIGTTTYNDWGFDMWDLSDQYVACAVTGGLATLVTFILVISRSFGRLGAARRLAGKDRKRQWSLWCLCAALLSHVVAYFGIGYFDQVQAAWYTLLAIIAVAVSKPIPSPVSQVQEALVSSPIGKESADWSVVGMDL